MITIPGKIPIRIYPIFWVFAILFSTMNSSSIAEILVWMSVIFISVVVHEMGHALTAVAFGQKAHIDLLGFGGLTHRHGKRLSAWKDFLIVLNGPLAGVGLIILSYYVLHLPFNYSSLGLYTITLFLYANIFWTVVNLIPVQPLDGGHLLRIMLEGIFGFRGIKIALFISLVLAIAVGIVFFSMGFILGGVLFMMLTYENYRAWRHSLVVTAADQNAPLQQLMKEAQNDYTMGNEAEALAKTEKIRSLAGSGMLYIGATIMQAELLAKQKSYQKAFTILNPLKGKLPSDALRLLQDIAYHAKNWVETIEIGTKAYQAEAHYEIAVLNAMAYAQLKEIQPAVGWLKRAVGDGLPYLDRVLAQPDFDPIRRDPLFQSVSQGG